MIDLFPFTVCQRVYGGPLQAYHKVLTCLLSIALIPNLVTAREFTVQKLDGTLIQGTLQNLTTTSLELQTADGLQQLSVAQLQSLQSETSARKLQAPVVLKLNDGSVLGCEAIRYTPESLQLTMSLEGNVPLAVQGLQSCEFPQAREEAPELWQSLASRERVNDLLVIRKGDRFDFVAGVVSEIKDDFLQFLFDKRAVSVPLARAYGIWFRDQVSSSVHPIMVTLANGNRWQVSAVMYKQGQWTLQRSGGTTFEIEEAKLSSIDFSVGRMTPLEDLSPVQESYESIFDVTWPLSKGSNLEGEALRLAGNQYTNGISLHSWSRVRYSLEGRFSRFQTLVGIDDQTRQWGDVTLTIRGDGQELLQQEFKGSDGAVELDLDVSGIRDLELTVDYGPSGSPVGDRLNFVQARLLKAR